MRCSYCGSNYHTLLNCPKTYCGSAHREHMRCTYCGGTDHTIEGCPKTYGGSAARSWYEDSVADHFVKDK